MLSQSRAEVASYVHSRELQNIPIKQRVKRIEYCMANHTEHETDEMFAACECCGGLGVAATCPGCGGAGNIQQFVTLREAQLAGKPLLQQCDVCRGRGQLQITRELFEQLGRRVPVTFDWLGGKLKIM